MLFWKISNFWRENGRGRHRGAKGSGASRPDQKVGPLGQSFGSTVNSKTWFQKFRALIKVYFFCGKQYGGIIMIKLAHILYMNQYSCSGEDNEKSKVIKDKNRK